MSEKQNRKKSGLKGFRTDDFCGTSAGSPNLATYTTEMINIHSLENSPKKARALMG